MSSTSVRRASHTDIDKLIQLLGVLFSMETDFTIDENKQRRGLELMLEDKINRCIVVAEKSQEIIGMCTAQIIVSTAEGGLSALIEDLVIEYAHRGQGIGEQLLATIESWAIEKGVKRLQLLADRNNTPALRFYNNLKWKNTQLICLHKKEFQG